MVLASVKSFTAATSNLSGCLALVARRTKRPILPNPLIPTRVVNSYLRNFGDSDGLGAAAAAEVMLSYVGLVIVVGIGIFSWFVWRLISFLTRKPDHGGE